MKSKIKNILEIIVFVILMIFVLNKISLFEKAYGYEDNPNRSATLFYELPNNTVDILMMGDSHVYCGLIPQKIFDDYGYTAASLASGNQKILNTYWLLKEAITKQKIQILILDVHSLEASSRKNDTISTFEVGALLLPDLSINKIKCFNEIEKLNYEFSDEAKLSNVYGLTKCNGDFCRYNVNIYDFINYLKNPLSQYKTFGYYKTFNTMKVESLNKGNHYGNNNYKDSIDIEYLNKIYDLCEEEKIKVVLLRLPFNSEDTNIDKCDYIIELSKKRNVDFIDYFDLENDIELDLNKDFRDNTHLNYYGAIKATNYLGKYIYNNYNIKDHRNDNKYKIWVENIHSYDSNYK